jgi:type I restriction enzyme S subunit
MFVFNFHGLDMSSEQTISVEEACELVVDCPHSTPVWTESGVTVLRNENIRNGRLDLSKQSFTDEEHFRGRIRRAEPQSGDIVITREAPMGEVCMIPDGLRCCLGQRQVLLRPSKHYFGRFMLYALQAPFAQHQISWNEGTGSTVSNIRIPVLKSLQLPCPEIGEQIRRAAVLTALDDRIDHNRIVAAKLEAIARTLFKSWFVDFDPVRAKAAGESVPGLADDIAKLFPDRLVESDIGEIPEGFEPVTVGEVLELAYGKALKASDRKGGNVPVYGSGGIVGWHDEAIVPNSTVVVGRKGSVGTLYWEDRASYPIDTTFFVKPKSAPMSFCFFALSNLPLQNMNTDAAVPGLNRNNVYRLPIVLPTKPVMEAWESFISPVRQLIVTKNTEIQKLVEIRDLLLPRLISGKLEVADAEQQIEDAIA